MQIASFLRQVILSSEAYLAIPYFSTCPKGTIIGKSYRKQNVSLQLLSEISLIPRRIQRDTITNVHSSSCKVPVAPHTLMKLKFARQILQKSSNIQAL